MTTHSSRAVADGSVAPLSRCAGTNYRRIVPDGARQIATTLDAQRPFEVTHG